MSPWKWTILKGNESSSNHQFSGDTVDGRNPAPVDMVNIPLFTGFDTSQLVQDFFHQQYVSFEGGNHQWVQDFGITCTYPTHSSDMLSFKSQVHALRLLLKDTRFGDGNNSKVFNAFCQPLDFSLVSKLVFQASCFKWYVSFRGSIIFVFFSQWSMIFHQPWPSNFLVANLHPQPIS